MTLITTPRLALADLDSALRQPFPAAQIHLLPQTPKQRRDGQWICRAVPSAEQSTYEDRLNVLAFGQWSTPALSPLLAGTTVIVPVTVEICGVMHTAYGEALLTHLTDQASEADLEASGVIAAYAQGFRRACAKFSLGRYLSTLERVWVPYDPACKEIILSPAQRLAHVNRLYQAASLLPSPAADRPIATEAEPPALSEGTLQGTTTLSPSQQATLDWIRTQLHSQRMMTQVCRHYQITDLEALTHEQMLDLVNRLLQRQERHRTTPSRALTPSTHIQGGQQHGA